MKSRARHGFVAALLFGLLAVEIVHSLRRLRAAESRAVEEALAELRGEVSRQAARLENDLSLGKDHARYLASLPSIGEVLRTGSNGGFERAGQEAMGFLFHFPAFGSVTLLDASGNERLRVERMGGGVALVPRPLLREAADPQRARRTLAVPRGDVLVSPLEFDSSRVDVAERDRQVVRYSTPVRGETGAEGALTLSLYAAPLFDALRRFEPSPGVVPFLVDASGAYLAHPDRVRETREVGSGGSFSRDDPSAFEAIVRRGEGVATIAGERVVGAPTGPRLSGDEPAWYLMARVPLGSLRRSAAALREETVEVGLLLLATVGALGVVGFVFLRLSLSQARLEFERETERRLAEAERLASLGRLTAGVAHEVNNPLEGIGNYIALLEREGDRPERRREYVGMLRHGFERIRAIVRDLLSIAHPPTPRREPVDLREVLDRVARVVRHDPRFHRVVWEARYDPDLPRVPGDPFALEQVFLNLALNARDAMGESGRIRVEALGGAEKGSRVVVLLDDWGPGIPSDTLPRIFEPFFSTRGGTGLGLSVSESIVRAHGGTLRAENRPEGGARFVLTFPAAAAPRSGIPGEPR